MSPPWPSNFTFAEATCSQSFPDWLQSHVRMPARLRDLRLGGMAQVLERQQEQIGTPDALPFRDRLGLLVEQECLERERRKQGRLVRQARFKLRATIQDVDYQHRRNIQQSQIARLACAVGHNACLHGYSVRYYRLSRLLPELTQAKADGSYRKLLFQLGRVQLLIMD